jgi:photosystem II stability/assembly factor-like uncharacterized protein/sugar lactone lactonase YvrE
VLAPKEPLLLGILILLTLGFAQSSFASDRIQVVDMSFVDELHGWVSVLDPTPEIFRTSDGGQTWVRIPIDSETGFYLLHFFNQNTGFAIQHESEETAALFRTVDAGQTWRKVNAFKKGQNGFVDCLTLTGPDDGFVVGFGEIGTGHVNQFLDGGRTTRPLRNLPVNLEGDSTSSGIFGDGSGHLWIVGKELILHSPDNGRTWENQNSNAVPEIDSGVSGAALPGGHAWIAVADFEIYMTDDYGKHWVRSLSTAREKMMNFDSVSFSSLWQGCAVGNSSDIYCTEDAGLAWSRRKVFNTYPNGSPFRSKLLLFDSSHGWASVNGALYKTEDGGRSFIEVLTSSGPMEPELPGESQALQTSINGPTELAYDETGFLYIVESNQGRLLRLDMKHDSLKVMVLEPEHGLYRDFDFPQAIATDRSGNLFVADFNGRLRELDHRSGQFSILLPAAPERSARGLDLPESMTLDARGYVLIDDRQHKVFRWRPEIRVLETVAGTGVLGFHGDGGLATDAKLGFPQGLAVDPAGNIFIADYQNCRIRKIDAKTQIISTVAGTGECTSKGDGGLALRAAIEYPSSLAIDTTGNLFFVEGDGERVRRIDQNGVVTTYAGTGLAGFSGDGGPAEEAMLNDPSGLAVDGNGNLFISKFVNNRIRRVDAVTHVITTVAGNGEPHRVDILM